MSKTNAQHLLVGYLPTTTPNNFLHIEVSYRLKRGYFVTVNAVELENSGGFACTKFGVFDGGFQSYLLEPAARFNAKKLRELALDLCTKLAVKEVPDDLTIAIVKSCEAKTLVLARFDGPLTAEAAFGSVTK